MIAPPKPPSHDELEALIKEARARQLRRRLLGAAGIAIAAAIGLSVYAFVSGGKLDSVGQPPAQGGRATGPLCRSSQLSGSVFFQGATQTMLGGVTIENRGGATCSMPNRRPAASIMWRGKRLPTHESAFAGPGVSRPADVLARAQAPPSSGNGRAAEARSRGPQSAPPSCCGSDTASS